MKKILLIFIFFIFLILPAFADIMPYYVNSINKDSIGVYQASNCIKVYKEPNENSALLLNAAWNDKIFNAADTSAGNLFVVFLPKKNLAFLTVVDENENGDWLQIVYNRNENKIGWIKKEEEYRFMNWRTFINLYGRKYGLYYMKDAPEESKIIYGTNVENAKSIGKITYPGAIKLTTIQGNWVLIIAFDVDKLQKIGWIKWRNLSGEIYLFPNIK